METITKKLNGFQGRTGLITGTLQVTTPTTL